MSQQCAHEHGVGVAVVAGAAVEFYESIGGVHRLGGGVVGADVEVDGFDAVGAGVVEQGVEQPAADPLPAGVRVGGDREDVGLGAGNAQAGEAEEFRARGVADSCGVEDDEVPARGCQLGPEVGL